MSKKTNTLWFILGATIFNILVTLISFVILFFLFVKFLMPRLPEDAVAWSLPLLFVAAIVLSFIVYRIVIKQLFKRINVENHFDPIFGGRRRPPAPKD
ncbi:MAG: leader peptide processing enzyme [Treponema sp.]|jgi:membrane protein implicated in regulation of membrane protease activity|nr:leader peptide processing enzyme [Treponema sp.]